MDSVIPIDMGRDYDPNKLTLEEATDRIEEEAEYSATQKLMALAGKTGDFSEAVSAVDLTRIGAEVVEDYETDKKDRKEWEDTVREALEAASQSGKGEAKTYPWPNASSVRFPILTTAALQYNARMYPAVVKGDEAVLCKVIGQDNGRPVMGPQGPAMQPGPDGQPQPVWIIPPGGKAKKARRVGEYLNTVLFYRMEDCSCRSSVACFASCGSTAHWVSRARHWSQPCACMFHRVPAVLRRLRGSQRNCRTFMRTSSTSVFGRGVTETLI